MNLRPNIPAFVAGWVGTAWWAFHDGYALALHWVTARVPDGDVLMLANDVGDVPGVAFLGLAALLPAGAALVGLVALGLVPGIAGTVRVVRAVSRRVSWRHWPGSRRKRRARSCEADLVSVSAAAIPPRQTRRWPLWGLLAGGGRLSRAVISGSLVRAGACGCWCCQSGWTRAGVSLLAGSVIGAVFAIPAMVEWQARAWLPPLETARAAGKNEIPVRWVVVGLPRESPAYGARRVALTARAGALHQGDAGDSIDAEVANVAGRVPAAWSSRKGFRARLNVFVDTGGASDPSTMLPDFLPGTCWRGVLRPREPTGLHNGAGFDAGRWWFASGLHVGGTVAAVEALPREACHGLYSAADRLHGWRYALDQRWFSAGESSPPDGSMDGPTDGSSDVTSDAPGSDASGMARALLLGERDGISSRVWALLLATGTNHLIAISGLHVGLVAGFAGWIAMAFWTLLARWVRLPSRRRFSLVAAVLAAAGYAALAGFSVPTQRALIMTLVAAAALWSGRRLRPWIVFAVALMAVLLWDVRAVLTPGFWFSFAAVAIILVYLDGSVRIAGFAAATRLQAVLALATLPIAGAAFGIWSWVSPVANLVAVPWVGLVALPMLLLGALIELVAPVPGRWLLDAGIAVLDALLVVLEWLDALTISVNFGERMAWLAVWMLIAGGLLQAAWASGVVSRGLSLSLAAALVLAVAAFFVEPRERIAPGAFRVDVVDVGQGLAVIVQTRESVLVYDTGPAWPGGNDAGRAALLPVLDHLGVRRVDRIVISHEDLDHRGGVDSLRHRFPDAAILRRQPDADHSRERECIAGQSWGRDGVHFEVLHPPAGWDAGNAASCVLRVAGEHGTLLLTGDVEGLGETVLMRNNSENLQVDVLLVPHHGARAALTRGLLDAAQPSLALVASGRSNRFGHPHPEAIKRLEAARLTRRCSILDTGDLGRITVWLDSRGVSVAPGSRERERRPWSAATRVNGESSAGSRDAGCDSNLNTGDNTSDGVP